LASVNNRKKSTDKQSKACDNNKTGKGNSSKERFYEYFKYKEDLREYSNMIDEGQSRVSEVNPAEVKPKKDSYKGKGSKTGPKDLIGEDVEFDRRNSEDTLYLLRQSSVGEKFSDLGSGEGVQSFTNDKGKAGGKYRLASKKESKGSLGEAGRLMEESYAREMALEFELRALRDQRCSYGAKAQLESEARLKWTKFDAGKKMASPSMQEGVRLPVPNSTEYQSMIEPPANFAKDPKRSPKKKSKKDLEYNN
jgi:hypothetical protein